MKILPITALTITAVSVMFIVLAILMGTREIYDTVKFKKALKNNKNEEEIVQSSELKVNRMIKYSNKCPKCNNLSIGIIYCENKHYWHCKNEHFWNKEEGLTDIPCNLYEKEDDLKHVCPICFRKATIFTDCYPESFECLNGHKWNEDREILGEDDKC
jgi:hypothetical protein